MDLEYSNDANGVCAKSLVDSFGSSFSSSTQHDVNELYTILFEALSDSSRFLKSSIEDLFTIKL